MANEGDRVIRQFKDFVEQSIGKLELRIYQTITLATPVDTGFARGAWTPSLGSSDESISEPPTVRNKAKASGRKNRAENNRKSKFIAKNYKLSVAPIYISNNVPYIGFLNNGSSSQAPARFVEAAIAQAVSATFRIRLRP